MKRLNFVAGTLVSLALVEFRTLRRRQLQARPAGQSGQTISCAVRFCWTELRIKLSATATPPTLLTACLSSRETMKPIPPDRTRPFRLAPTASCCSISGCRRSNGDCAPSSSCGRIAAGALRFGDVRRVRRPDGTPGSGSVPAAILSGAAIPQHAIAAGGSGQLRSRSRLERALRPCHITVRWRLGLRARLCARRDISAGAGCHHTPSKTAFPHTGSTFLTAGSLGPVVDEPGSTSSSFTTVLIGMSGADFGFDPALTGGDVPEPATWTMLLIGFGGLGAMLHVGAAQPRSKRDCEGRPLARGLKHFSALSRNRTVGSQNVGDTRWHLPQLSRVPAKTAWNTSSVRRDAWSGLTAAQAAARFQTFRDATRAAMRLPSSLRAYALPAEA